MLIPITIDDYVFKEWGGAKRQEIMDKVVGDFRGWKDPAKFDVALQKFIRALNVVDLDIKPPSFL